ncbi:helix-turn-helix domain-containing protein [Paenibacillus roseipurpureus]|uniref:AraC family transcriptional regulator n=1 Tax=Paenibacillus roseopurpureus TaxID=2918901 RepID=A0AA96RL27_9BACL|nr:AraC family transcriptional regulator [Paenibacillus sp. MBLB1832]WNR42682.1 AraC family transcriptional regulator [Paenibacillus sp. MBLB1832]
MRDVEEKARCFHYLHGIDILGADHDGKLLFACIHPERQQLYANAPSLLKEMMGEMARVNHPFFTFWTPDSCLYHALSIGMETEKLTLLLGPIGLTSTESNYDKRILSKNRKELEYLGRLFYWLFVKEESEIPRSLTYNISHTPSLHISPEVSLVNLYYEQEPLHITLEEYDRIKEKMQTGDVSIVQSHLDALSSFQEGFNRFELASGDILRSAKNHFISTCAIVCQIAVQSGVENEYARTMAYKFVVRAENLGTRAEIVLLMKEMILKFTAAIKQFANPQYSSLVREIIQYMHVHFFEKITLNEVADKFGKHPSYISNKINLETGQSFSDNLNEIRITESKRLLTASQKSINEIAVAVGFDYQNHFSKVFKKITGITPSEYRNKQRMNVADPLS